MEEDDHCVHTSQQPTCKTVHKINDNDNNKGYSYVDLEERM